MSRRVTTIPQVQNNETMEYIEQSRTVTPATTEGERENFVAFHPKCRNRELI